MSVFASTAAIGADVGGDVLGPGAKAPAICANGQVPGKHTPPQLVQGGLAVLLASNSVAAVFGAAVFGVRTDRNGP